MITKTFCQKLNRLSSVEEFFKVRETRTASRTWTSAFDEDNIFQFCDISNDPDQFFDIPNVFDQSCNIYNDLSQFCDISYDFDTVVQKVLDVVPWQLPQQSRAVTPDRERVLDNRSWIPEEV